MGFALPDIIVESVIRDGLENIRRKPEIIDDIFSTLTMSYASKKYGNRELNRLKQLIAKKQINVVHSFSEINAKVPCYSLQLGSDVEDRRLARLGDFEDDLQIQITDPTALAELVRVSNVVVDSYDKLSGILNINDAVNLADVYANLLFVDADGTEFVIKGGINNLPGEKTIQIEAGSTPNVSSPGEIKSSLNYEQYEVNGVTHDVQIIVGVHTKDALTTKYLYVLLKYFIMSRREDLIRRCFIVASLQGSDFTRNFEYQGDIVFNRFLTVHGKVEDSWNGKEVQLIDNIETVTLVEQAPGPFPQTDETLERTDQTVQINEEVSDDS